MLLIGLFLGCPVMAAIGCTAVAAMAFFMENNFWSNFATIAFEQGTSPNQLIAPLFILMAEFLARGGIAEDIFSVLNVLMKKIKGGLAIATTLACTIFAALCGSSPATAGRCRPHRHGFHDKAEIPKGFRHRHRGRRRHARHHDPAEHHPCRLRHPHDTSIAKLLMAASCPGSCSPR
jgi:hypothetical protein